MAKSQTLGQTIGKVDHVFSITNHAKDKVQIKVTFDFSTASDDEVKAWLISDRTIAFQRPSRSLSADEIKDLNNTVILASDAGKKVKSRAEKIAELVNVGIPEKLATMAVDNPAAFEKIMADLNN